MQVVSCLIFFGVVLFDKSTLNNIRDRVSIVSLVGERLALKRAGRNFKACCPFHNEKTPSFNVSDEKGIYHCFGCGEGGDIFQFLMKFDGLSFSDSVKYLAGKAGVELPTDKNFVDSSKEEETSRKKRTFLRINEIVRDYYVSRILDPQTGQRARQYLQIREIKDEFLTQLFLGYAENKWDSLVAHLEAKKVPLEEASELGLIKKRDSGGYYDFFRDRIMFPIISPRGEVLGFSGRALSGDEAAKYLNSPDSLIYHKSNCIFGLNLAQGEIRAKDQVILVEGNIDLASLHQAGIGNVVAPLGTALTAGHIRLLRRYTQNFVVLFDGDDAGRKAALRSLELFLAEGISARMVLLPKGEDPDSYVKKNGADGLLKLVAGAVSLFEYFVDSAVAQAGSDASGKALALKTIVPLLALVSDPAGRSVYRRYISRRLDVDESALDQSLSISGRQVSLKLAQAGPSGKKIDLLSAPSVERMLLELTLSFPNLAGDIFGDIEPAEISDEWCRTVFVQAHSIWKETGKFSVGAMMEELGDSELASQIRQMSLGTEKVGEDEVNELIRDCIMSIRKKPKLARLEKLNEEIRFAEKTGEEGRLIQLLSEKNKLAMNLRKK